MIRTTNTLAESMSFKGITSFSANDATSFCRMASIERFGDVGYKTKGFICDEDIHGLKWNERAILEVIAYDRTEGKVILKNPNGITFSCNADKITFCHKDGSHA